MKPFFVLLLGVLGLSLLAAGAFFYADPVLLTAEVTMRTGLEFFRGALPAPLIASGVFIILIGIYDGINRLSDALMIPLGLISLVLGLAFWKRPDDAIAVLDMLLPDGNALTLLSIMIGACGVAPLFAAWKLSTEDWYPGKRPAA